MYTQIKRNFSLLLFLPAVELYINTTAGPAGVRSPLELPEAWMLASCWINLVLRLDAPLGMRVVPLSEAAAEVL